MRSAEYGSGYSCNFVNNLRCCTFELACGLQFGVWIIVVCIICNGKCGFEGLEKYSDA